MASIYRRSVNLIPKASVEEIKEKEHQSTAGLYAALLPMFGALIWLLLIFINNSYQNEINKLDTEISSLNTKIATYDPYVARHTELVRKTDALYELVRRDFEPGKFFFDVNDNLSSTKDAKAEIYSYERSEDGKFTIKGIASSYVDLAKIMVVFSNNTKFVNVLIKKISFDEVADVVNFEITFEYKEYLDKLSTI